MSSLGFWLIRLTIWLAVAAWLLRVFIDASRRDFAARDRLVRWTWLIGAASCLAHVVCAMGFAHCWSLTNAMRHTATVTRQVIGIELPLSVFVNFAFTALWLIDATQEFRSHPLRRLGFVRQLTWAVMMLNGTIVFGPSYWKWFAVPCVVVLTGLCVFRVSPQHGGQT